MARHPPRVTIPDPKMCRDHDPSTQKTAGIHWDPTQNTHDPEIPGLLYCSYYISWCLPQSQGRYKGGCLYRIFFVQSTPAGPQGILSNEFCSALMCFGHHRRPPPVCVKKNSFATAHSLQRRAVPTANRGDAGPPLPWPLTSACGMREVFSASTGRPHCSPIWGV